MDIQHGVVDAGDEGSGGSNSIDERHAVSPPLEIERVSFGSTGAEGDIAAACGIFRDRLHSHPRYAGLQVSAPTRRVDAAAPHVCECSAGVDLIMEGRQCE